MQIPFAKMQGLGNDFVVFDATENPLELTPEMASFIADRHFGIGCDQILVAEPPRSATADFTYRIYNADGSESGQCGNGARCFALFLRQQGLTVHDAIVVDVPGGTMRIESLTAGRFRVEMAVPEFTPADIPFEACDIAPEYELDVNGQSLTVQVMAIGNPHAVIQVDDIDAAPVGQLGPLVERHRRFPQRVNAGFMQADGRNRLRLRVYERGVGETLACGSGACAAAIAARRGLGMGADIEVSLPGGILTVQWAGDAEPVYLTGPAARVFDGMLDLAAIGQQ